MFKIEKEDKPVKAVYVCDHVFLNDKCIKCGKAPEPVKVITKKKGK